MKNMQPVFESSIYENFLKKKWFPHLNLRENGLIASGLAFSSGVSKWCWKFMLFWWFFLELKRSTSIQFEYLYLVLFSFPFKLKEMFSLLILLLLSSKMSSSKKHMKQDSNMPYDINSSMQSETNELYSQAALLKTETPQQEVKINRNHVMDYSQVIFLYI